jgi:LPXTG-motif cell wall-anchored protein
MEGSGVNDVAFNNEITGNLTVIKKWFDKDSNLNPENHTELSLYIQNRVVGTDDWNLYKEIKLSSGNLTQDRNWKYVETNLPLIDESGNPLEYRVVEPDSYRALYSISYSYNGTDYYANQCDNDPDYAMSLRDGDDGSKTFGEVTITNKTVTINELPSTGGMGTAPLIALGALLISMAVSGFILYKKKETI